MTSVFNTPVKILIEKFKELSAEDKALFLLEVFTICNENNRIPIIRISKKISKTSKVVYTGSPLIRSDTPETRGPN